MSGKELSLKSKIFAGAFVLVAWLLNAIFRWNIATVDIVYVGIFLALLFAPVDVSKWLEKFGRKEV
jgi:hypothetical protein